MEPNILEMLDGPFEQLLSFGEAASIWGIDESSLRKAVANGRLIPGEDCRKFGKQWVVTIGAMAREFRGGWCPLENYLRDQKREKDLNDQSCENCRFRDGCTPENSERDNGWCENYERE